MLFRYVQIVMKAIYVIQGVLKYIFFFIITTLVTNYSNNQKFTNITNLSHIQIVFYIVKMLKNFYFKHHLQKLHFYYRFSKSSYNNGISKYEIFKHVYNYTIDLTKL